MAEAKRSGRIDVHHHFYAPEYLAVMGDMAKRPVVPDWTMAHSLEELDRIGVGTGFLSLSPPGLRDAGAGANGVGAHAAEILDFEAE
jgi:hypothetical protein